MDDETPILGQGAVEESDLGTQHQREVHQTLKNGLSASTVRDYRIRHARIIKFWQKNCPEYYKIGVRQNTHEEMHTPAMFYFGGDFTHDIIYKGLNVQFVLNYLNSRQIKDDGKYRTHGDLRKDNNAILWGAKIREEQLSSDFHEKIEQYLGAFKKLETTEKQNGNVETNEADPISFDLYRLLCKWCAEEGNIYSLFWTVTQWNCIARCGSVDPLGFRNFRIEEDSHAITHDKTKKDQEGERCFAKHVYPNAEDFLICHWTTMALYCALHKDEIVASQNGCFFRKANTKAGTAAKLYQDQLHGIVNRSEEHKNSVKQHCRIGHFNAYGLRKGSASYATSGTTQAPSLSSVAHRGDWSMGSVFDIYWRFLPIGDQYLGQILSGTDPNKASFKTLPPHWIMVDPMGHPLIKKAMQDNFGPILNAYAKDKDTDPTGLLLRCLACAVWHSASIQELIPTRQLSKIPLFGTQCQLEDLKELVTTEPTEGVMTKVTGIPPHVEVAAKLEVLCESMNALIRQVKDHEKKQEERDNELKAQMAKTVEDAIEQRNLSNGNVSGYRLEQILQGYREQNKSDLTEKFEELVRQLSSRIGELQPEEPAPENPIRQQPDANGGRVRLFDGKGKMNYWHVPMNFEFPDQPNLAQALRLWLLGSRPARNQEVRPYRKIEKDRLPTKELQNQFATQWKQLFKFVESAGLELPLDTESMTTEDIERTNENMWAILKERVSYCFAETPRRKRKSPESVALSTWASKVLKSNILAKGTEQDKSFFADRRIAKRKTIPGNNKPRKRKEHPKYPRRQKKQRTNAPTEVTANNPTTRVAANTPTPGLSNIQAAIRRELDRMKGLDGYDVPNDPPAFVVTADMKKTPEEVQMLIDRYGNKQNRKDKVTDRRLFEYGACACAGCYYVLLLNGPMTHSCAQCGIVVHSACSRDRNWWYEIPAKLPFYFCSEMCMYRHMKL